MKFPKGPLLRIRQKAQTDVNSDELEKTDGIEEIHIPAQSQETEEERTKGIATIREVTATDDIAKIDAEEPEEDEEYEYVTPNYIPRAIMLTLGAMLIGAAVAFILTNSSLQRKAREIYLAQGYVQTKNAVATSRDIAKGKTAYVNGELIEGSYVEIDTSKATATANDVLKGYTCYVDGEKVTGSIPIFKPESYNGDSKDKVIPKGFYLDGTVINIAGAPNLTKENIKEGVTIFGVTGTYNGE